MGAGRRRYQRVFRLNKGVVDRIYANEFVAMTSTNRAKMYGLYRRRSSTRSASMPILCCGRQP